MSFFSSMPALLALALAFQLPILAAASATILSGEEIMKRAVTNSNRAADRLAKQSLIYSKKSVLERVDDRGKSHEREERLYRVLFKEGKVQMRLVELDGKAVSAENDESDFSSTEAPQDASRAPRGEERPLYITAPTIAKYHFTVVGEPVIGGRPTFELKFHPRTNLTEKNLVDRFLNQVKGRLWVDASDFEIVRAQLHLQAPVTLWGGVLGALKRFDYNLERERLKDGFWFNRVSSGDFEMRKLFFGKRFRTQSEWNDVRKE